MRNSIIIFVMILSGILFIGCGGTSEKEKTETKTPAAASISNSPAANTNSQQTINDSDDTRRTSEPASNTADQAANQKRVDADDIRGNSRTNSKLVSNRRDSDDLNKRDNDRDDDDH